MPVFQPKDLRDLPAPSRVIDRSFIRLENISVAYNVPEECLSKFKIQNAKISLPYAMWLLGARNGNMEILRPATSHHELTL